MVYDAQRTPDRIGAQANIATVELGHNVNRFLKYSFILRALDSNYHYHNLLQKHFFKKAYNIYCSENLTFFL